MDDGLKYFKLLGDTLDKDIVLACKPEEVDNIRIKLKDYELEECEQPKNANVVMGEPCINEDALPFTMLNPFISRENKPRRAIYNGPNCVRCANRFKSSIWCNKHYHETKNCYRFKLKQ